MKEFYILIEYPESDWGTDLVKFTVPEHVSKYAVRKNIYDELRSLSNKNKFFSQQDMAEFALCRAARELGGSREYIPIADNIKIR